MKNFTRKFLRKFLLYPLIAVTAIWFMVTGCGIAAMLMRQPSDLAVVAGMLALVCVVFSAALVGAFIRNEIKDHRAAKQEETKT